MVVPVKLFRSFDVAGWVTIAAFAVCVPALIWLVVSARSKSPIPKWEIPALVTVSLFTAVPAVVVALTFLEILPREWSLPEALQGPLLMLGMFFAMMFGIGSFLMLIVANIAVRTIKRTGVYFSYVDGLALACGGSLAAYYYIERSWANAANSALAASFFILFALPNFAYRLSLNPGERDYFDGIIAWIRRVFAISRPEPGDDRVRTQGLQALQEEFRTNLPAVIEEPQEVVPIEEAVQRPTDGLQLMMKRSQRNTIMGNPMFVLDARLHVSQADRKLVGRYKLAELVVYDSKARRRSAEAAADRFERSREGANFGDSVGTAAWSATKQLFNVGWGAASAISASLSLRITVGSLMRGVHVECKSMDELLEAEEAILESGKSIAGYLRVAETFDGRQIVIDL